MKTHWCSKELDFRLIEAEDLSSIVPMLAKAEVCAQLFFGPNSEEQTRGYFTPFVEATVAALAEDRLPDSPVLVITRRTDQAFVGQCALIAEALVPGVYEVGYQLDAPFWRKGYGRQACELLVGLAFTALEARRLEAGCMATNPGSRRILEGCGFSLEGTRRQRFSKDGELRDELLFGLLSTEVHDARLAPWAERYC